MKLDIRRQLQHSPGYATGIRFAPADLVRVKQIIKDHLIERVKAVDREHLERYAACDLESYHTISQFVSHSKLVTRTDRILAAEAVEELRGMSLFKELSSEFGYCPISDEERVGRGNILMRLVRPRENDDVGSLHCDDWFWKIYNFHVPIGVQRVKVWVAVCCEAGKSGLLISPNSHSREWKYTVTDRGGMLKPVLDSPESPDLKLVDTEPGEGVLFNYHLLHGGAVTQGTITRVSLEFTILVPDEVYFV